MHSLKQHLRPSCARSSLILSLRPHFELAQMFDSCSMATNAPFSTGVAAATISAAVTCKLLQRTKHQTTQEDLATVTTCVPADVYQGSRQNRQKLDEGDIVDVKADPFDPRPRQGYLSWDDYFMAVAFLSAQRSKDPNKQVGACIVSTEQIILGIGYNGFPRGCSDSKLPWAKKSRACDLLDTKYPYVCHAEMNAILNKNTASLAGTRIYVTMFPCNECAKLLIQAGVKEVIFYEDKMQKSSTASPTKGGISPDQAYIASKRLLAMAGLNVRQHRPHKPLTLHIL